MHASNSEPAAAEFTSSERSILKNELAENNSPNRLEQIVADNRNIYGSGNKFILPVIPVQGYRDLWEVRSRISDGRIARVIFHMSGGEMILLHGLIKKTQQTPQRDLELADRRRREYESNA